MRSRNDVYHNQKRNISKITSKTTSPIETFVTLPKRQNNMITAKDVTKAVQKMANNKAPRKDNINVELIKYAPEEFHQEIS